MSGHLWSAIFSVIVYQRDYPLISVIDDYAKDGGPGEVWLLCSFYHDPLRSLIVKEVQ